MMKWACMVVALVWCAVLFVTAFEGELHVVHFGAATGWLAAAYAFLASEMERRWP